MSKGNNLKNPQNNNKNNFTLKKPNNSVVHPCNLNTWEGEKNGKMKSSLSNTTCVKSTKAIQSRLHLKTQPTQKKLVLGCQDT